MATTITAPGVSITPTVVDGYTANREAQSIVHTILGKQSPDITFRDALLRSGTLTLKFAGATSEDDSAEAEIAHAGAQVFFLTSDERATIEMSYVVAGGPVVRTLDDDSRDAWIVEVPYQEIETV